MSKHEHFGICHICGQYQKLTYEHIPPEAAFNSIRQKLCSVETLLKTPNGDNRPPWDTTGMPYEPFQRGTGFYTLCSRCNSYTGTKYGEVYSSVIQSMGNELIKIPKGNRKVGLEFHVENMNSLAFFKQIISMFCSVNTPQFGEQFKEFLLDENNLAFNQKKYKVFMYLHAGKVVRFVPFQGQVDIHTGNMVLFSEISTFPVGFILYDISTERTTSFCGCDITSFSSCSYGATHKADIPIPFLACNTPFGLDFRAL